MRILYLAHRIPYPPNKGDKIRSFNEIKYISHSHEVHLACLADDSADLIFRNDLEQYCRNICVVPLNTAKARVKSVVSLISETPLSVRYFYSKSLQRTIDQWLSSNSYDAIICFSSPMAEYIFRSTVFKFKQPYALHFAPCAGRGRPRLIMDFCDLDSDKWLQYSRQQRFPVNLFYRIEHRRLLKYEKKINEHFDYSVFVSEQESDLFSRSHPGARDVSVIPNGVDSEYFSPKPNKLNKPKQSNKPVLLFTGAMDYYANMDGVTWFVDKIFPRIKQEWPKCQFYIVGSNPHSKVTNLERISGVSVTGFVEDTRPYYNAANVCVIPLRLARGVQNKVLEAMAMEKAVVATSKAIQGIDAIPKEHALIEDTREGFSRAILTLLRVPRLRKGLGERARAFVKANYTWPTHMKKFETLLQKGPIIP